jgi:septum formation protein
MPRARHSRRPSLILASASPRRRELLRLLNCPFDTLSTNTDEVPQPGESAPAMVERLSRAKAQAARLQRPDNIILALDTDVELDGTILGKPIDAANARAMLEALRGRAHSVYSAFTLAADTTLETQLVHTRVWMRDYSDAEVETYVASGDPLDKAASYAVQHRSFRPVARVEGCFANVMGLPICQLYHALAQYVGLGQPQIECHQHPEERCTVESLVAEGAIAGH